MMSFMEMITLTAVKQVNDLMGVASLTYGSPAGVYAGGFYLKVPSFGWDIRTVTAGSP